MADGPNMNMLASDARLRALENSGLPDSRPEETFDRLTLIVKRLLGVPVSLISLVEPHRQFFKSQQGLPEPWASQRETPLSHSFCQHVVIEGQPLSVPDAREHPVLCENLAIPELGVAAYLGVPLLSPDGEILGSLCAIDVEPRAWRDIDTETLHTLSDIATDALRLRAELRERQKAEQAQSLLVHELGHRVKNTLATMQAMVALSIKVSDDPKALEKTLTARIRAMSRCHDLLARPDWQRASLHELLEMELQPYRGLQHISVDGEDVHFPAHLAPYVGMILHELATNAAKYGALSAEDGRLSVAWTLERRPAGRHLALTWQERGGPPVRRPERSGFGSQLIGGLIKAEFNGEVVPDFAADGLTVRLRLELPEPDAE